MEAAEAERRERERQHAKLLAQQQREIDRRGEEDEKRARAVDRLSAVILLESYLDSKRLDRE